MAAVASSGVQNAHLQSQLTRSLDRILEEAQLSGELKLSGRKLKDFPSSASRYNLIDTVVADLSKNRLSEVPCALGSFPFLERLQLYHNVIRNIPSEAICALRLLTHLDLSRNQLTSLPRELCALPLKVLLISHNKLTQLPDEICRLTKLAELDASCNKLTQLPSRNFSALIQLRSLLLRDNLLTYLTVEVTTLPLERLDLRENRIGSLPIELRLMHNLIELRLDDNPLTCPPAAICKRGRVHIFKYLELEAAQRSQTRPNADVRRTLSQRSNVGLPMHINRHRRHNIDSGYSTSDGYDRRWSQEIQAGGELGPLNVSTPDGSRVSTPSTISPGGHSLSDEQGRSASSLSTTADTPSSSGPDDKTKQLPFQHIQTYKEYKEALRQQRNQDAPTAYRARTNGDAGSTPCTPTHRKSTAMASSKSDPTPLHKLTTITTPMVNGSSSPNKTVSRSPVYTKPPSPVKTCNGGLSHDNVPPGRTSAIPTRKTTTLTWNKEVPPDKLSFTMRREFDKAKEESGLIEQLRSIIETKLKMSLPEDLAPALSDGVVLCHLANHVRPRSVASIHVPSPAVPKLTMARCRRNVDNFLEACRKIGIEEELLCAVEPMLRQLQVATRTFTDTVVSALCLIVFIGTVILLTLYPPPN